MTRYPDLRIEKYRGGRATWWRVAEDCLCQDVDVEFVIPKGYVSNFGSIPKLLYPVIYPHGRSAIPSVKHDFRYTELVGVEKHGYWKARTAADAQYIPDLMAEGMKPWAARLLWTGLRLGGWWHWMKHTKYKLEGRSWGQVCESFDVQ